MAMRRFLSVDLARAFSTRFLLALLLFITLRWLSIYEEFAILAQLEYGHANMTYFSLFILNTMGIGAFSALTLLPFGEAYALDRKSGFFRYYMIKGDPDMYIRSKLWTLILSSLCVGVAAYTAIFLFAAMYMPWGDPNLLSYTSAYPILQMEAKHPVILIVMLTLLRCLYLTFLAMASFAVNLYLQNRLMLFMGPSLIFAVSIRIGSILRGSFGLTGLDLISYGHLPGNSPYLTFLVSVLILMIAIGVVAGIAYHKMQGDASNE